jgi:hypothetical protein
MSRLPLPAALMTIAVLTAVPGAAAKEITAMKICGADSCAQLKRSTAQRLHGGLGGAPTSAAVGRVPYYRVVVTIGDGRDDSAGHFSMAYAPRHDAVLPLDSHPPGPWMRLSDATAKTLDRVAGRIEPIPAERLRVRSSPATAPSPRVRKPSQEAEAKDDGGLPPLLAGVPAILIVGLGLGLLVLRRR